MKWIAVLAVGLSLIGGVGPAYACNASELETNMAWAVRNNAEARQEIAAAYDLVGRPGFDGLALERIIRAFRDAQSHNPSAAGTIDGCSAIAVVTAAKKALGR